MLQKDSVPIHILERIRTRLKPADYLSLEAVSQMSDERFESVFNSRGRSHMPLYFYNEQGERKTRRAQVNDRGKKYSVWSILLLHHRGMSGSKANKSNCNDPYCFNPWCGIQFAGQMKRKNKLPVEQVIRRKRPRLDQGNSSGADEGSWLSEMELEMGESSMCGDEEFADNSEQTEDEMEYSAATPRNSISSSQLESVIQFATPSLTSSSSSEGNNESENDLQKPDVEISDDIHNFYITYLPSGRINLSALARADDLARQGMMMVQ